MSDERTDIAVHLFREAYASQMRGNLDEAVLLYKKSIEMLPTAEAYTFLGWTYRFQGKIQAAIEECKHAIMIDPTLGNPYNDIGAYLIDLGRPKEAVSWLERALRAARYEAYHYAWFNLGRAMLLTDQYSEAQRCFERALEIEPNYAIAAEALGNLKRLLQ
jgi:Tfp pilus assembly protein PilF